MTKDEIREVVLHTLHMIAPEAELDEINPEGNLQEEIELDSLDFLRFMQQLNKDLGVDVPEADYEQLSTLNRCVDYFVSKIP